MGVWGCFLFAFGSGLVLNCYCSATEWLEGVGEEFSWWWRDGWYHGGSWRAGTGGSFSALGWVPTGWGVLDNACCIFVVVCIFFMFVFLIACAGALLNSLG